jgi:hypothetical protein
MLCGRGQGEGAGITKENKQEKREITKTLIQQLECKKLRKWRKKWDIVRKK